MRCPSAVPLILAAALAACASPSPEFFGVTPQRLDVEGTEIVVYHRGDRAQAIRMGFARPGEHGVIIDRMIVAIEQTTGCRVPPGQTDGDSGVLNARLAC